MLRHLDASPITSNSISDATSSRQLLMTVRLYFNIDIYPERYPIRVDFSLEFSLSTELVKGRVKLDQESSYSLSEIYLRFEQRQLLKTKR